MRSTYRVLIVLTAAALGLAVVVAASARQAVAGKSGGWSQISGPRDSGFQLGLARAGDGTLHVVWNHGNPSTSIFDTRFSSGGSRLGTTTVATNWGGDEALALLLMPDKTLRLFATGSIANGSPIDGVSTFTAPADGSSWTLDPNARWGGAGAGASSIIGATLTKDGQPVTAWAGWVNVGLSASYAQNPLYPDMLGGALATDASSGGVVFAAETIYKQGGTFVQQALPSLGPQVVLPSGTVTVGESGISGRLGAPGVYVAYSDYGTSAKTPSFRLYRYGGPTRTIAKGAFTVTKVFPGPDGRLWLVWGDAKDGIFVTRTNKGAGALEPVQKLKLPAGTSQLWNAQAEGSAGPLDLFADVSNDANTARGFWHVHLLARLRASASAARAKGKPSTVTVRVTDAGDPVAAAGVKLGSQSRTTDAAGKATFTLPAHRSFHGSVSASGYQPASLTVHS